MADEKAREERKARVEAERLAVLWRYQEATVGGGRQVTASILSIDNLDTDGTGAKPVQLVFRDHASWGRSSYLVLQAGDFDCAPRCSVSVTVDDLAPEKMAARRPKTDEAIAMFINDAAALWRLTSSARRHQHRVPREGWRHPHRQLRCRGSRRVEDAGVGRWPGIADRATAASRRQRSQSAEPRAVCEPVRRARAAAPRAGSRRRQR